MSELEKELSAIEARANTATEGPWRAGTEQDPKYVSKDPGCGYSRVWSLYAEKGPDGPNWPMWNTDGGCPGYGLTREDAEFCADARTTIPRLAAALRSYAQIGEKIRVMSVRANTRENFPVLYADALWDLAREVEAVFAALKGEK